MKESIVLKLAVLSISSLLVSGAAINGALPEMRDAMGITQTQSELLGTAPSISVMIFVMLSSFIASKIGMKKTVVIGIFLVGIGGMTPMFANSYVQVLISRIIFGAGIGLFNSYAVSYINILYKGDTQATLLGFRNTAEGLGQSFLTILAGVLLNIGWHYSFAVYVFAFPIAIFFYLTVPDIEESNNKTETENLPQEKMNPTLYLWVLFAIVLVISASAISIRFPSIATEIQGTGYNASLFLALMPILGAISGSLYGTLNKLIGKNVFYLGLGLFVLANFLMGFSNGNFGILLAGFFLLGIPGAWCFPFIFATVSEITTGRNQNLAMSMIFAGINIGGFLAPFVMQGMKRMTGSEALEAPFPIFGIILFAILIGIIFNDKVKKQEIKTVSVN